MANFTGQWSIPADGFNATYPLQIEIVTTVFTYTTLLAGIPFTEPAFDMALDEIRATYPNLNITRHLIYPPSDIRSCVDWAAINDEAVAAHFYDRKKRPKKPALRVYILPGMWDIPQSVLYTY